MSVNWLESFGEEQRHAHAMQQAELRNEHRRTLHRRKSDAALEQLLADIRIARAGWAALDLAKAEAVLVQAMGRRRS